MHACAIADELNVPKVYFPKEPGVFSAEGIADALILWESASVHACLSTYANGPQEISTLKQRAFAKAANYQRFEEATPEITLVADCHYRGQSHTLAVEISNEQWESSKLAQWLSEAFIEQHRELYGYVLEEGTEVLLASLRLKLIYHPWQKPNESSEHRPAVETYGPTIQQATVLPYIYPMVGRPPG